jgi:K(+)-stimulated pyrophosphate-energized sodium pump
VGESASTPLRIAIALVAAAIIVGAVTVAKKRSTSISGTPAETKVG